MPPKSSRITIVFAALLIAAVMPLTVGDAAQFPGRATPQPGDDPAAAEKVKKANSPFTPKQLSRLQDRIALATSILDAHEAEAQATGLASGWRRAYMEMLMPLSLGGLQQMVGAGSLNQLAAMAAQGNGGVSPTSLGSSTEDLVYVPIAPCRYVDTRNVGGQFAGTRGYDISLDGSTYGGSAACDPTVQFGVGENGFGALAINLTIVTPVSAPGFGAIKPTAAAPVTSSINWYEAGAIVANQGIYTTDQSGAADEFVVEISQSAHAVLDIFGAFVAPEATALSTQVVSTVQNPTGIFDFTSPVCPAGYSYVGPGHNWSVSGTTDVWFWQVSPNVTTGTPTNTRCRGFVNLGGSSTTITCYGVCARVPGR